MTSGRVVVITGAANGIGLAIAEAFAAKGFRLALIDRSDKITAVASDLGAGHKGYVVDLEDTAGIPGVFSKIAEDFGNIHVLVNNAGIGLLKPAPDLTVSDWDRTMAINLRAPFLCAQAVFPVMKKQNWGRIVSIASQAAVIGIEAHAAYCASKAGVVGMTNCLAIEWGPFGITSNCISPTVVETELAKAYWVGKKGENAKAQIPTKRFAQPSEIAASVMFLASDDAAMINGANLLVDGGNTIQ